MNIIYFFGFENEILYAFVGSSEKFLNDTMKDKIKRQISNAEIGSYNSNVLGGKK